MPIDEEEEFRGDDTVPVHINDTEAIFKLFDNLKRRESNDVLVRELQEKLLFTRQALDKLMTINKQLCSMGKDLAEDLRSSGELIKRLKRQIESQKVSNDFISNKTFQFHKKRMTSFVHLMAALSMALVGIGIIISALT